MEGAQLGGQGADARAMGLDALLADAGAMEISGVRYYTDRSPADPYRWAQDSIGALPEIGFHHPRLQDAAFRWAAAQ